MKRTHLSPSRWLLVRFVLPVYWFCVAPVVGAMLHTDDFQNGAAGWTTGGSTTSLQTSGGPAGESDAFWQVSASSGNLATHNSTPPWTGDFTAIDAVMVTVDLMVPPSDTPLNVRWVMFGPGTQPNFAPRWTTTLAAEVPNDGVWRSYDFSLAEEDLTQVIFGSGGQGYDDLMEGVLRVMLRHDPGGPSSGGSPVTGTLGIDNVTLRTADPPVLAGDYNGDGAVDVGDYTRWRDALGGAADSLLNSVDAGPIGLSHYNTWKTNYATADPAANFQQVPEPAGGLVLLSAVGVAIAGQRGIRAIKRAGPCQ